jgi:putative ABC transport system permease protein
VRLTEHTDVAVAGLRSHALRSALSTLGIVVGTTAVIAVVSVLQGFQHALSKEMEVLGASYVVIVPDRKPPEPGVPPVPPHLTWEDGQALPSRVRGIRLISPAVARPMNTGYRDRRHRVNVIGVGDQWQALRDQWVDKGRFFSRLELEQRRKVAVIGTRVADELQLGPAPLGREVLVADTPFTVVGVLEKRGRSLGRDADDVVLVPFDTALGLFGRLSGEEIEVHIQAESPEAARALKDAVTPLLRQRHRLRADQPDDFTVLLQDEVLRSLEGVLSAATAVVAAVVGVSLLVAGIGIMNVMLVSVTERTHEIGLRKAVGARRRDILQQFLIEAVVLCSAGGLAGTALGYGLAALLTHSVRQLPAAHVPVLAVALTFVFCALVGIFFGMYPAGRAARLDPIEALRYD